MANLISVQGLSKAYDSRPLFDDITFGIEEGDRVGLIGPNGSGKSTLLKILAGHLDSDHGKMVFRKNTKVAYLAQDPQFRSNVSVRECLLEGAPDPDDWSFSQQADELLNRLGLDQMLEPETMIDRLSGGWKKRLAVARELMKRPDLFLLDEPTNHLDVEGILWLEDLLKNSPFASIVVTHDRLFLDRVSKRILELDRRNINGLLIIDGNYSRYLEIKEKLMESQENREKILRGILRRESEWLRAGVKAQRSKQFARIERHAELTSEIQTIAQRNTSRSTEMEFQEAASSPKRLLEAKKISKSFGNATPLFSDLSLMMSPGTRLGLLGENGCGKSTLIRVLLGEEPPDRGHLFHSDQLKVAYFEQNRDKLDPQISLMRTVCPYGDGVIFQGRSVHIRSYLDRFLFDQSQMDLPVGKLSGGEQSRVLLAKLMLIECNLLVLDEPTNDLDIPTLNVLQDCLTEFEGAVILVSHDRYFLDQVSTQILAFPPIQGRLPGENVHLFEDLAQWEIWRKSRPRAPARMTNASKKSSRVVVSETPRAATPSNSKEIDRITRRIEQVEEKIKKLEDECAKPEFAGDVAKLVEKGKEIQALHSELDDLYKKWERA